MSLADESTFDPVDSTNVLTTEISASWWGYAGQALRTMTIDAEPTDLYVELHDVAEAVYDAILETLRSGATAADIVEAAGVIEDAGFTTYDDLVHRFGGGYLPPILGSTSRTIAPVLDMESRPGMATVIQPNVVTPDHRAGVQTGSLVAITDGAPMSLHSIERGFWQTGYPTRIQPNSG